MDSHPAVAGPRRTVPRGTPCVDVTVDDGSRPRQPLQDPTPVRDQWHVAPICARVPPGGVRAHHTGAQRSIQSLCRRATQAPILPCSRRQPWTGRRRAAEGSPSRSDRWRTPSEPSHHVLGCPMCRLHPPPWRVAVAHGPRFGSVRSGDPQTAGGHDPPRPIAHETIQTAMPSVSCVPSPPGPSAFTTPANPRDGPLFANPNVWAFLPNPVHAWRQMGVFHVERLGVHEANLGSCRHPDVVVAAAYGRPEDWDAPAGTTQEASDTRPEHGSGGLVVTPHRSHPRGRHRPFPAVPAICAFPGRSRLQPCRTHTDSCRTETCALPRSPPPCAAPVGGAVASAGDPGTPPR